MITEPTVYIIDDDQSVRKGLSRLIGTEYPKVEAFSSADDFLRTVNLARPACVVLDLHMPGVGGLELQELLRRNDVTVPIVFLTANGDVPIAVKAMKKGAIDFLTKPVSDDEMFAALGRGLEQDNLEITRRAELQRINKCVDTLTQRELEVLAHVITGMPNKRIGDRLGTSEKTVKVHRGRVMRKMEADSIVDLVRMAGTAGIEPAEA